MALQGADRHGRQGLAGRGMASHGESWPGRQGAERPGAERPGQERQARRGQARLGVARYAMVRQRKAGTTGYDATPQNPTRRDMTYFFAITAAILFVIRYTQWVIERE